MAARYGRAMTADQDRRAAEGEWVDCPNCGGDGVIDGECTCMDDTCCCLVPEPPECDECEGAGGWFVALSSPPESEE